MPLLLTMTLCGSVGTLIYFILNPLTERFFTLQWRKTYLTCCIFCFLIPFPCITTQYKNWINKILARFLSQEAVTEPTYVDITGIAVQMTGNEVYIPNGLMYAFIICVVIVGSVVFGYRMYKHHLVKKYFQRNKNIVANEKNYAVIQEYTTKHHVKENIRICEYNGRGKLFSPVTMGVFRPIIVLPPLNWEKRDLEMVLEHEITHIKQRDNLIKILALIVIVLNFYNPLSYYLIRKWTHLCEMCCDQKVLAGKTSEEVKRYGALIIRMATNQKDNRLYPILGLSMNMQEKELEERIHNMKKEVKKERLLKKVLGIGTMGAALFLSSLSVLAYSPKKIAHMERITDEVLFAERVDEWEQENTNNLEVSDDGWIFVDENGEVIATSEDGEGVSQHSLFCQHNYVDGQVRGHTKTDGGGCIVDYYKANRCNKCGDFNIGELISTHIYAKCPH